MPHPLVLVVDDEDLVRNTISHWLAHSGFQPLEAENGSVAIDMLQHHEPEVALVDLVMPDLSGLEVTRQIKNLSPDVEVIILTGYPTLETTLAAIREQVFDYVCKPPEMQALMRTVARAVERRGLLRQNRDLIRQLELERNGLKTQVAAAHRALEKRIEMSHQLIGQSESMVQVRRLIAEVAPSDMTVLLRGESGTGKDTAARMINQLSGRENTGNFLKINCPAIPETLLESELFGHEPGAFTGADRRKPGRFELAANGTIFLDEIGEMSINLQAKLLQVIEQKQFTRLGGSDMIHVDTRIIAATNAPLESMMSSGRFSSDLFCRLNEYSIALPPLRDRTEDIPLLVNHFMNRHSGTPGMDSSEITPETMGLLMKYPWPGNVRELEAVLRRFCLTKQEDTIRSAMAGQ